tara:strand:+ start:985 stop:1863 length:879 start_codon:yes stop_codon:yes gene_type:complete
MPINEDYYQNPGEAATIADAEMSIDPRYYVEEFLPDDGFTTYDSWNNEYGMYIDPYNPTMEAFIDEASLMQQERLMSEMLSEKGALDANTSALGFAGSSMVLDDLETLTSAAESKSDEIMLASQKEKFLERESWKSNLYTMLANLANLDAFEPSTVCDADNVTCHDTLGGEVCVDQNGNICGGMMHGESFDSWIGGGSDSDSGTSGTDVGGEIGGSEGDTVGAGEGFTGMEGGFGTGGTSGFEEEASDIIIHDDGCPPGTYWDMTTGSCTGGTVIPEEGCSEYEAMWGLNGC